MDVVTCFDAFHWMEREPALVVALTPRPGAQSGSQEQAPHSLVLPSTPEARDASSHITPQGQRHARRAARRRSIQDVQPDDVQSHHDPPLLLAASLVEQAGMAQSSDPRVGQPEDVLVPIPFITKLYLTRS